MPSRKGKGRQSLGFATKSQRAQFHTEWQSRMNEDYYTQKRRQQKEQQRRQQQQQRWHQMRSSSSSSQQQRPSDQKPAAHLHSLRRLIAERQYWDRVEDRSWMFSHSSFQTSQGSRLVASHSSNDKSNNPAAFSPPGWLVYHTTQTDEADTFAQDYGSMISNSNNQNQNQPDDNDRSKYTSRSGSFPRIPTLQSLCLQALAKSLPHYLEALGVDLLHHYMSLLPGPALTVLSVEVSRQGFMTHVLAQVLGRHSHLTRFSLVACAKCDETDPQWKDLRPNVALRETFLQPSSSHYTTILTNDDDDDQDENDTPTNNRKALALLLPTDVPDSWEDLWDDDQDHLPNHNSHFGGADDDNDPSLSFPPLSSLVSALSPSSSPSCMPPAWRGCWALERLELGNLPLLEVDLLQQVLQVCPLLTHLGLSGSLTYDRGPDVLWKLSEWAPRLQVLDVSGNTSWVTEPLLRCVYESYYALRSESPLTCRSVGGAESSDLLDENTELKVVVGDGNPQQPQPQPQPQPPYRQPCRHIVIKATGCLTRSSQIMLEAEFGTLF